MFEYTFIKATSYLIFIIIIICLYFSNYKFIIYWRLRWFNKFNPKNKSPLKITMYLYLYVFIKYKSKTKNLKIVNFHMLNRRLIKKTHNNESS